ncbi:MAG: Ig-like domain-containing protein, partial [Acidobacteriota bacterium]|nr:Ig-like domain-containing protein [Acidobacteriota bacterium]
VLTFTAAPNAFGVANVTVTLSDNGGTANGGSDTSGQQTFVITVTGVNDVPSFTSGGDVTVLEDSAAYSSAWASGMNAGANETQTLTFNVSNNNNALFSVQPAISASGLLTFTLAPDANGTATVSVTISDNGGTANGGVDTSSIQTFAINATAVNDAPSFAKGADVTVLEDSAAFTQGGWATSLSKGPADESGQTLSFNVSNDNPALFSVAPAVNAAGQLTFTVAPNAFGTATVTLSIADNGGTANGGADTSATQTFVINVTGVNDMPSFTSGGNLTVLEDSAAYNAAWAGSLDAGPGESGQTLSFNVTNNNNAMFSVQPAIDASGVLTFTLAPDAIGVATVSVTISDNGGTANGGVNTSGAQNFSISVTAVNDAPSFTKGTDVTVLEDSGAFTQGGWASGLSKGPADEGTQT